MSEIVLLIGILLIAVTIIGACNSPKEKSGLRKYNLGSKRDESLLDIIEGKK